MSADKISDKVGHDYRVVITPLPDAEGGGYLATVPDLPGCVSDGTTREEAARNVGDAILEWIDEAERLGRDVLAPADDVRGGRRNVGGRRAQ
jgi:antitoxin HicB